MSDDLTKEQEILITLRKVLSEILKEITPPPGMKHPLSEQTLQDVRNCFGLIAAREHELAQAQGRGGERPHYVDEARQSEVVPISRIGRPKKSD